MALSSFALSSCAMSSSPLSFLKSSMSPYSSSTSSTSFFFNQHLLIPGSCSYSGSATSFHNSGNGLKLRQLKITAVSNDEKRIPLQPDHWEFCYTILPMVSRNFTPVIQQLDAQFRDAACILYLLLRAIDTVEDDTRLPADIKVPILKAFHRHIYDTTWHFSCGTEHDKILMDEFRHVSNAFLGLERGYQEAIEDIIKKMGAGMAKFVSKEVETMDDCDEYCYHSTGLTLLGFHKLFHASGLEDLPSDSIINSLGLFYYKTHIIQDYLKDINEIPKSRMFWPREIWSKYVSRLEDLQYEENSVKAMQCLNDMVTNALTPVEDCLIYMSTLKEPSVLRFYAVLLIMTMGNLALCYNNIEVFQGFVVMRRGLFAKVFDRTETMADVYGAFFDFSCIMKSKVNKNNLNATETLSRLDAIQKACRDSGLLNMKRKLYII